MALLKSVFTHMHPNDVRHYLKELGRVIRSGGRAVITYFLLNDESRALVAQDRDEVKMKVDWAGIPSAVSPTWRSRSTRRRTTKTAFVRSRRRRGSLSTRSRLETGVGVRRCWGCKT